MQERAKEKGCKGEKIIPKDGCNVREKSNSEKTYKAEGVLSLLTFDFTFCHTISLSLSFHRIVPNLCPFTPQIPPFMIGLGKTGQQGCPLFTFSYCWGERSFSFLTFSFSHFPNCSTFPVIEICCVCLKLVNFKKKRKSREKERKRDTPFILSFFRPLLSSETRKGKEYEMFVFYFSRSFSLTWTFFRGFRK